MKEFTIHGTVMQCYPLTAAQRLHHYTIRYCPRHQVLNIGTGLYIQIDLDFNLLREVIYQAYERQDSMRVRFLQDEDGTVYQYVVPFEEREIPFYDFSHWKEEDAHAEMRKWTAVPFKRYHSPMNQVVMVKLPDGYNGIYLKVDHMTMDSSSIIGFHRDVLELYCAKRYGTNVPKPMQSYLKAIERDLVYENDSPAKKKDEAFWKQEIAKSEPMYTDFTGMGRLLTQRRETNNPDLRNAIITSSSLDAAISVYHLEADPSDRLMQFCLDN